MIKFKLTTLSLALAAIAFGTNSFASAPGQDPWPGGTRPADSVQLSSSNFNFGAAKTQTLVALGYHSLAMGSDSLAIGSYAQTVAAGGGSVALGASSYASTEGGLALGAGSVAARASGATDAVTFNGKVLDATSGSAWVSTKGAASIGSASVTRQLMGVAAGSADTDAVNVAQLKSLQQSSVFGSGASNVITPAVTGDDGTVTTEAETATNAAILGNNATVKAHNGAAFGYNAQVMADAPEGSVAIGANSVATMAGRNAAAPFVPGDATVETSNGGAWASTGLVSFGYTETTDEGTVTRNRTLTGVAAGSEDNDAVNVAQLKEVNDQVTKLTTGQTAISKIDLLANPDDPTSGGIGLRFEAATQPGGSAEGMAAQAEGDEIGRLAYTDIDGTKRQVATMSDGFTISAGSSSSEAREGEAAPVKVDLNKGISFLTDSEYLSTNVAADGNGGAVVTFNTTQALKDALANAGGSTGGNTGGDSGSSGNTGGSGWTPSQAQLAAMNGNFANGITVAPGEGNQAIQIKQGNVDMGGNRIQNVGNPINDGDAANKAYVDSTSRSLRNKINDVDKDLRAGVAMAMAVGGLPQAYMPGKSIVGVSAGTYHGQGGFALGLSHATDNRQWVFKGAASVDTRGNFGGQLSAGYQF